MNRFAATLLECEREGCLSLSRLRLDNGVELTALSAGLGGVGEAGARLYVAIKAAEVSLARPPLPAISLRNRLPGRVLRLEHGRLLSRIMLDCAGLSLEVLITRRGADELALELGDEVIALVKANELTVLADVD
ncbi:TOBE domain-containing protein [Craterilacuibacter sp. RT1T]|uniref:TOBE domain-containing protein n=1 Tax=Craterilacuibacter sp. RT1T TaxID=2942211 RepID=UPI0020C00605|nr:TOBE domain-containing protein [Craterilacuibacter sp. RT1T]MCL6264361.1 TOBE domain-containing protein [Craterilacuibacter sp. RT1T]